MAVTIDPVMIVQVRVDNARTAEILTARLHPGARSTAAPNSRQGRERLRPSLPRTERRSPAIPRGHGTARDWTDNNCKADENAIIAAKAKAAIGRIPLKSS